MNTSLTIKAIIVMSLFSGLSLANSTSEVLQSYVDDYITDPMVETGVFAIKISEEAWTIQVTEVDQKIEASLKKGWPEKPTWYFNFVDPELMKRFTSGTMNAGTAMAKAFQSDKTPFDIEVMEGFQPDSTFLKKILSTTFHFWNKGIPEITHFNDAVTRFTHGTDVVVLHYQPGFRSAWFSIKKGQHVNEDPKSQTNPFPSMMVVTKGKGIARINDKEIAIKEGMSLFIPPQIKHEFWTNEEQPLEGVLLMFGEGA